ncbi:MAG: UDP-N-acetylmuramoyl-L-alanine--D-glutamate ligase [Oscillospiraceae bacterium]|nr:UDP-N-acetylmuramoyl-L-alanine--D-glutamate ligase [Oscillospiraceae bacterium]
MNKTTEQFYGQLKGKKVAFIGAGVSHKQCIEIFVQKGAVVTLCDKKQIEDFGAYGDTLKELGVHLSLGESYLDGLAGQDMIMRTPGFEFYTKELVAAGQSGSLITSEMELFFELCPCKIYAVTGSDGKTTTTTLISEMLKTAGYTVHLGGNIGRALLPIIDEVKPEHMAVVELSSFQLISMRRSPNVAVVTNVTPNHLDHHKDMQEYIDAKRNILLYQTADSKAVLGYENEISRSMQADVKGSLNFFTRLNKTQNGACLDDDGNLCLARSGVLTRVVHMDEVRLPGLHNIENMLCAMAAVDGDVKTAAMAAVAKTFAGVEHRIEPVRELNGVKWYNDSIASSPTRTIAGLRAFKQKVIIIAGGYDKKIPYEPLAPEIIEHVKELIVMGQTGPKIEAAVRACAGFAQSGLVIHHADSMEEAVQIAYKIAHTGDIVSLSPASASFDFYPNFEVRGQHFKQLVNAL